MIRLLTLALVAAMTGSVSAQKQQTLHSGYPIDPVPFTSVKVTDSFWGQRLKASREVTIPLAFSKCEETGRYENFVKATHPSDEYKVGGFSFDDTDVYKTIEGASYSLQTYPDKKTGRIYRQRIGHSGRRPRTGRVSLHRTYHEPQASARLVGAGTLVGGGEFEPRVL